MKLVLDNNFRIIDNAELLLIDAGGWKSVFYGVADGVLLVNSLAIGVIAGPGVGIGALGSGLYLLGCM